VEAIDGSPRNNRGEGHAGRESPNVQQQWERLLARMDEQLRLTAQALSGGPTTSLSHDSFGSRRSQPRPEPRTLTAVELDAVELPEPRWTVPGLLPEGLSLLGGRPRQGKSWFCLDLAIAVASGGQALGRIPVASGDVLYLALEDTPRSLRSRLRRLLQGRTPCSRLTIANTWPQESDDALPALESWLDRHPQTRLVVIDPLDFFCARPHAADRSTGDGRLLRALKAVADRYQVTLLGCATCGSCRRATRSTPSETLQPSARPPTPCCSSAAHGPALAPHFWSPAATWKKPSWPSTGMPPLVPGLSWAVPARSTAVRSARRSCASSASRTNRSPPGRSRS
jgi:hypothetical protein